MSSRHTSPGTLTLPVGAIVRVQWPTTTKDYMVVEDRGYLGIGGRQIVRIKALEEDFLGDDFEMPSELLEVLSLPRDRADALRRLRTLEDRPRRKNGVD